MNQSLFSGRSLRRALLLGLGLCLLFLVAGATLWLLTATVLGMDRIPAFFLVACATPFLVGIPLTLFMLNLPLERRRSLLGLDAGAAPPKKPDAR